MAKEIILFFSALGLVALVCFFLLLRNLYYDYKVRSYSEKVNSLKIQLDALPKDYVKELYDLMSKYFVVFYKIGNDTSIITKGQEEVYLKLGLPEKVTRLQQVSSGSYSYFKINRVTVKSGVTIYFSDRKDLGKQVKKIYSEYADMTDIELGSKVLKKFTKQTDSTIVFDFAPINKFREFVTSEDYVTKLYSVFSLNPDQDQKATVPLNKSKPQFNPMNPYNGVFELGTLSEFKKNVSKGLKYDQTVIKDKSRIEFNIHQQQEVVSRSKKSLLATDGIYRLLFYTLCVIGLFLYPVRLSILSILWAFKTLKQEK